MNRLFALCFLALLFTVQSSPSLLRLRPASEASPVGDTAPASGPAKPAVQPRQELQGQESNVWRKEPGEYLNEVEALQTRIRGRLRTLAPEVADLFTGPWINERIEREDVERLLTVSRTATGDDRAALLFAADWLAQSLHHWMSEDEYDERELVEEIAGYRLTYEAHLLGDPDWRYRHDLLWEAWGDGQTGEWAEEAFLYLQDNGWFVEGDCFREVILRGERFLAERPESPNAAKVSLAVAQAYHTWWSLSLAEGDGLVEPEKYREGAEAARQKAIAAYEKVRELAPSSPEAEEAAYAIPRLQLGRDTKERRFHCVSYC